MPSIKSAKTRHFIAKLIFKAANWPLVYLILGTLLCALSYTDDFFYLSRWKNTFELSDSLGTVLIALAFVSFTYRLIVFTLLHFEKKRDKHSLGAIILSSTRKGLRIIAMLIAINVIISIIGPNPFYLTLSHTIITTIIIGSIGWISIQILHAFEAVLYQNMIHLSYRENFRIKALYTKMHIIRNLATVVIVIITIAAILMSYSSVRNIGISLLASAGFLTALAGLAAQRTLFSLFSGLQIALAQPIKIGDTVVIERNTGTIEEITFTYVTLKLSDRRRLILPINYFIEKPFENWSHDISSLRGTIHLHVDFMMPLAPLRKELDRILMQSPFWDGTIKKMQVTKLTDRSVEVSIQLSAPSADSLSDLLAEVHEKILEFMQKDYPTSFPKINLPRGSITLQTVRDEESSTSE